MENDLKLYGADWCPKTSAISNFLQSEWMDFEYLNAETNEDAKEDLMKIYDGKVKFPTVTMNGKHIKNPSIGDLRKFLKEND